MAESTMYEILEVSDDATLAEIKAAYRRLAPQVHPDLGGSKALFRLVQEAYETLTGPDRDRSSSSAPADSSLGHVVPALAGTGTRVRAQRAKWVTALLAQERAVATRVCVCA